MKAHVFTKLLTSVASLAAVGAFDYLTGYDVSSYPAFLIPIFLGFFNFGKIGGYVACVLSVLTWGVLDYLNGHQVVFEVRFWNGMCRLLIYGLFVYGLSLYVKTVNIHRQRLEDIRRMLPMCHGCGKILWKDGTWKTPEEVLELADAEVVECPDCGRTSHA